MKFGRIVLQVNMHQLTESDFRFKVTDWRWWPDIISCRKMPPPGE